VRDAEPSAERAVVATVALGVLLAPLNSTMIAVALPRIADSFDASTSTVGWLVTGYLLVLIAGQAPAGRLGDVVGRRPAMLGGLAAFLLASVGASFAPSLPALIAFRLAQAAGVAIVVPNGFGLLRNVVPSGRRGRQFGVVGAAISSAAALGPVIGGGLIAADGWRAIFYVNLPVVAAALLLTWRFVPAERSRRDAHDPTPLLGLGFFRRKAFSAAWCGSALSNLAFYSTLIATPILLTRTRGWSSAEIGFALAALSAPSVLLAPVGGRLADRLGRRLPALAGNALLALSALPLALDPKLDPVALLVCLAGMGASVGLATAALQTTAVEAVPRDDAGSAAGLFATGRYAGSIVGTLVLASLLSGRHGAGGFYGVFAMIAAAALLSAVATLGLPSRRAVVHAELAPEAAGV
jgi:MFS family permease